MFQIRKDTAEKFSFHRAFRKWSRSRSRPLDRPIHRLWVCHEKPFQPREFIKSVTSQRLYLSFQQVIVSCLSSVKYSCSYSLCMIMHNNDVRGHKGWRVGFDKLVSWLTTFKQAHVGTWKFVFGGLAGLSRAFPVNIMSDRMIPGWNRFEDFIRPPWQCQKTAGY